MNHYNSVDDFAADVRLVFTNAKTYNIEFSDIHEMAKLVQNVFEDKFGAVFKGTPSKLYNSKEPQTLSVFFLTGKKRPVDVKQGSSKKLKHDSDDDLSDMSHELPEEPTEEEKVVHNHSSILHCCLIVCSL